MMKFTSLLVLLAPSSQAFVVLPHQHTQPLFSTTVDAPTTETTADALLDTVLKLKQEFGLFLVDRKAKTELTQAVEALEATAAAATESTTSTCTESLLGEWELLCTTSTTTKGIDTSMFLPGPLKQLSDTLSATTNKYVTVQQILKSEKEDGVLDRIDHVLAYQPPQALTDFLENIPQPLTNLNVNPLDVSQSKLVLVHKAETDEDDAIKLRLQSVIWNVAGNSTYLDPAGKDITSINLPWGEFLGSGTFTTTTYDDDIRISRGKQGFLDVLRVFQKKTTTPTDFVMDEEGMVIPDAEIINDIIDDGTPDDDIPSDVNGPGP